MPYSRIGICGREWPAPVIKIMNSNEFWLTFIFLPTKWLNVALDRNTGFEKVLFPSIKKGNTSRFLLLMSLFARQLVKFVGFSAYRNLLQFAKVRP